MSKPFCRTPDWASRRGDDAREPWQTTWLLLQIGGPLLLVTAALLLLEVYTRPSDFCKLLHIMRFLEDPKATALSVILSAIVGLLVSVDAVLWYYFLLILLLFR